MSCCGKGARAIRTGLCTFPFALSLPLSLGRYLSFACSAQLRSPRIVKNAIVFIYGEPQQTSHTSKKTNPRSPEVGHRPHQDPNALVEFGRLPPLMPVPMECAVTSRLSWSWMWSVGRYYGCRGGFSGCGCGRGGQYYGSACIR